MRVFVCVCVCSPTWWALLCYCAISLHASYPWDVPLLFCRAESNAVLWDEAVTQTCTLYQGSKGNFKRKKFTVAVIWNSCSEEAPGQEFGKVEVDLSRSAEVRLM